MKSSYVVWRHETSMIFFDTHSQHNTTYINSTSPKKSTGLQLMLLWVRGQFSNEKEIRQKRRCRLLSQIKLYSPVCSTCVHTAAQIHSPRQLLYIFRQNAASIHGNVCVCVISQFSSNIVWHRTRSFDIAGLILISPIDCWWHSTPFWCKASLGATKIDNSRI